MRSILTSIVGRIMIPKKILFLLIAQVVVFAAASSSSSYSSAATNTATTTSAAANYNVYHYDNTVQQFTPDGRLLQMEYAMAAAEQSSPLVVCQLMAATNNNVVVIMACSWTFGTSGKKRPQDRIVLVQDHHHHPQHDQKQQQQQQHREDVVVVAMSGVLPDSLKLLQLAWEEWQDYTTLYGFQDHPNDNRKLRVMVQAMGTASHAYCFQGGMRPLGATMLVAGLQPRPQLSTKMVQMFQTDPSGAVVPITIPNDDQRNHEAIQLLKIVGGNSNLQRRIEKAIERYNNNNNHTHNNPSTATSIGKQLQALAKILIQEQEQDFQPLAQPSPSSSSSSLSSTAKAFLLGRSKTASTKKKNVEEKDHDESTSNNNGPPTIPSSRRQPWIEAVVMSPELGVHRLTENQVEQLLPKAKTEAQPKDT